MVVDLVEAKPVQFGVEFNSTFLNGNDSRSHITVQERGVLIRGKINESAAGAYVVWKAVYSRG